MKRIEYRATYSNNNSGTVELDTVAVFARSINTGFAKATRLALKVPKGWTLTSIEFWEVTS